MPFVLDDSKVNRPVFPQFEQAKRRVPVAPARKPRKFSRSRLSAANRAERYLRELKQGLAQDSAVYAKVVQIEKEVRRRVAYTPRAKTRKQSREIASVHIAESTADIPGLVKQALGMQM